MHVLATWNVLHRIHAENWAEPAIAAHPDERVRIAAIAERIATVLVPSCAAVCLQEVSSDQLVALRRALPASVQVFASAYPRIPQPFRPGATSPLDDPTEYLATVVTANPARELDAAAFPSDGGKGYLAVELVGDGLIVINTHVSFGERHADQCAALAVVARRLAHRPGARAALLGDFNADRDTIIAALVPDFVAAELPADSIPTRPRGEPNARSQDIDHVIGLGGTPRGARVIPALGLSDHNIVEAQVD